MKFEVDNQTLRDLEIFDTVKDGTSVFDLFSNTRCLGGWKKLHGFLSSPLTDLDEIIERKEAIAFFQKHMPEGLDIDKDSLDFTEYYLRHSTFPTKPMSKFAAMERKLMDKLGPSKEYYLVEKGVSSTIGLLKSIHHFSLVLAEKLNADKSSTLLSKSNEEVLRILSKAEYERINEVKKVGVYETVEFDYVFRGTNKRDIKFILDLIYQYDAFFAIAEAANKHRLVFPEVLPTPANVLEVEGIFHPFVKNAIANDISFDRESNLLFVSGPNMAGKSTFLKALGVSVYLAHAGFPVPAKSMKLSVLSGLCTTINISDDLSSGYSHFYAEVLRIRHVAKRLEENNNMMVIFDELFRGTNVKDAYDGTLAIVSAFARIRSSFFVVSTHIIEVARELKVNDNIKFSYFEITQEEGHPVYTYKLKEGVSEDRLGMYIIKKEGLIDLINGIKG